MPVVPTPKPNDERQAESPWDRQDIGRLSQTTFRIVLRGFDRDEVRAVLDSVAADYRVLQLQNRSLQKQLASLEGVLKAYQREHNTTAATGRTSAVSLASDWGSHAAPDEAHKLVLHPAQHHTVASPAREEQPAADIVLMEAPVDAAATQPAILEPVERSTTIAMRHSLAIRKAHASTSDKAVETMLKNIDRALGGIPALPSE
jgi:DivIVA domain-containing protein